MNAEILAVGTELLMGQIANTNAQYLSRRLQDLGINVYYHSVVGDNPNRLKDSLALALSRADIVITTGGLGPTQDDLTKETIAEACGKELVYHEEIGVKIELFFEKMHKTMAENNKKQAYLPEGCIVVPNNNGTAPGCIIENDNNTIIMFPGPPNEMQPMFEDSVFPYLQNKTNRVIESKMVRIFGIGESELENKIVSIINEQNNPTIAPYVKQGEVTLRVTASSNNKANAQKLIMPVIVKLKNIIGDNIYSIENEDLKDVVGKMLLEKNKTISLAESCTGGMLAQMLVSIDGISSVFNRSYVTYSNEAKVQDLGVNIETINNYGAVSEQTACEMAKGLKDKLNTDITLAITGIAGPNGGTKEKPVGRVYIAADINNKMYTKELTIPGKRERVRHVACLHALDLIRKNL